MYSRGTCEWVEGRGKPVLCGCKEKLEHIQATEYNFLSFEYHFSVESSMRLWGERILKVLKNSKIFSCVSCHYCGLVTRWNSGKWWVNNERTFSMRSVLICPLLLQKVSCPPSTSKLVFLLKETQNKQADRLGERKLWWIGLGWLPDTPQATFSLLPWPGQAEKTGWKKLMDQDNIRKNVYHRQKGHDVGETNLLSI